jgi:IS5 family transposase
MSVGLHGKQAQESTVLIDTTVQERNITYPTDAKLAKLFKDKQAHLSLIGFEGLPLSRQ